MRDTRIPHWQAKGRQEVSSKLSPRPQHSPFTSKRSGLEKAIFQVEEAIKKRKSDAPAHQKTLEQLQILLNDVQDEDGASALPEQTPGLKSVHDPFSSESGDMKPPAALQHSGGDHAGGSSDDQLAVEDVENPLQLLARASDLRITSPLDIAASTPGSKINGSEHSAYLDVHQFFLPMKANLDQGEGYDPIHIGLVSESEANTLLT